jgi:hypothetical protein
LSGYCLGRIQGSVQAPDGLIVEDVQFSDLLRKRPF